MASSSIPHSHTPTIDSLHDVPDRHAQRSHQQQQEVEEKDPDVAEQQALGR